MDLRKVLALTDKYSKAAAVALDNMEECVAEHKMDEAAKWAAIATANNTTLLTIQNAANSLPAGLF